MARKSAKIWRGKSRGLALYRARGITGETGASRAEACVHRSGTGESGVSLKTQPAGLQAQQRRQLQGAVHNVPRPLLSRQVWGRGTKPKRWSPPTQWECTGGGNVRATLAAMRAKDQGGRQGGPQERAPAVKGSSEHEGPERAWEGRPFSTSRTGA